MEGFSPGDRVFIDVSGEEDWRETRRPIYRVAGFKQDKPGGWGTLVRLVPAPGYRLNPEVWIPLSWLSHVDDVITRLGILAGS